MTNITHKIKLDVACLAPTVQIPAVQGDNITRVIQAEFYDSRTNDTLSFTEGTETAKCLIQRYDGVLIELDATISLNYMISVALTDEALQTAGLALCTLKVQDGNEILSASFVIDVKPKAMGIVGGGYVAQNVNIKAVSAADFAGMEKASNTLYIVSDGNSTALYMGDSPASGSQGYTYVCSGTDDVANLITYISSLPEGAYIRIVGNLHIDENFTFNTNTTPYTLDFADCNVTVADDISFPFELSNVTIKNLYLEISRGVGIYADHCKIIDCNIVANAKAATTGIECHNDTKVIGTDVKMISDTTYAVTGIRCEDGNSTISNCNVEVTVTQALSRNKASAVSCNSCKITGSNLTTYGVSSGVAALRLGDSITVVTASRIRSYLTRGNDNSAIVDSMENVLFLNDVICDGVEVDEYVQLNPLNVPNAKGSYSGYFFAAPTNTGSMVDNGAVIAENWDDELVSLVPTMTGYTTPSGEVIYSSNYWNLNHDEESRLAWYAFDGTDSQTFSSSAWSDSANVIDGDPDTVYCGYIFPEGTEVKVHEVEVASFSDRNYTAVIQTYDGDSWTTAAENVTIPGDPRYNKQTVAFSEDVICKGIRLCIVSGAEQYMASTRYGCAICEITVNGYNKL